MKPTYEAPLTKQLTAKLFRPEIETNSYCMEIWTKERCLLYFFIERNQIKEPLGQLTEEEKTKLMKQLVMHSEAASIMCYGKYQ
jgi:hypothetical protein